jgi:hypothetical protein
MMWNEWEHNNPPAPFNPEAKSYASEVWSKVAPSMEADGFYDAHTREECSVEFKRRYALAMEKFEKELDSRR